jgi:hypothetical protein
MSKDFTHIVLTRFNTAINYAPSNKRLERDWLNGRLALFEHYCLPSMRAQRDAEFTWLIFFDAASPDWFREKIAGYGSLVTPIYIEGPATDDVLAGKVAASGLVSSRYLITTRLDNDDGLAYTHLALVQQAFRGQEREFVEFPFGLQLFRDHLYNVYWPSNPFLSLIERVADRFSTVLCIEHNRVRTAGAVRSILRSPQWLQVLHNSNVLNALRGWPRLKARKHPNFKVIWPEIENRDTLATRARFSAALYASRASKLARKVRTRLHLGGSR